MSRLVIWLDWMLLLSGRKTVMGLVLGRRLTMLGLWSVKTFPVAPVSRMVLVRNLSREALIW